VLRTLDGPPRVPFKLTCVPAEALAVADVSIQDLLSSADPPVVVASDGRGEVTAGAYNLQLGFPDDVGFQRASFYAEILPPNRTWYAEVDLA
jgi:hypothetical protein